MKRSIALTFLCAANTAFAAPSIDACNAGFQTVLEAAPAKLEARAIWRDGRTISWPGAPDEGVVRLVSPSGTLPLVFEDATYKVSEANAARLPDLLRGPLMLVREDVGGAALASTRTQTAKLLDALYPAAAQLTDLGATVSPTRTSFKLWAPTAREVSVCVFDSGSGAAKQLLAMERDAATGAWAANASADLSGKYYTYLVDVFVDGHGWMRNLVTDPYSVSLTTDSKRSYITSLDAHKPQGWDKQRSPATVKAQTDMTVYELHVRDFSINDPSVRTPWRGKYLAFSEPNSNGMKHLRALAKAGMTDIHLLPVFDFGSVPETGCVTPRPSGAPDGEEQQALLKLTAEKDCFNWGYDPVHYSAPEGSYATDAADGARRIMEFRSMVQALHQAGLRVGMDVVYNHTFTAGQNEKSVLDRIVPGYYHRLNAAGVIERSTCCDNTATENAMMAKLMIDSVALWAKEYKIDSFRFDLMGHQPRAAMEALQARLGKHIQLIGEGWNFGEVENGARFVQASQLSLNGSGIGTFSDRARDAVRGGGAGDSGVKMISQQGFINGLVFDPNALGGAHTSDALGRAGDLVKVGLAGSLRSYVLKTYTGESKPMSAIDYAGQPAGYASQPAEAVNYVENHDNQTLFDINVMKLPLATSTRDRARVQMLGAAINAFSQGVAYFHAGLDILRSKSLDRNSFNAGDWFNRIDWSYRDNYFATGLPSMDDNGADKDLLRPLLGNQTIKPTPADIAWSRDVFRELLAVRASSTLFRLRTAADIEQRLRFLDTGAATVIAARIDGAGYPGAQFKAVSYFINVDKRAHEVKLDPATCGALRPHPALRSMQGTLNCAAANVSIPARTAMVLVE